MGVSEEEVGMCWGKGVSIYADGQYGSYLNAFLFRYVVVNVSVWR